MLLRPTGNKNVLASAAFVETQAQTVKMTASLCVIHAEDTGRVLVTHRAKDGQLGLPCGKRDPGESYRDAAYRELEEETGIGLSNLKDPIDYLQEINFRGAQIAVYSGIATVEVPVGPSAGFENEGPASWMTVEEILNTKSLFQDFNTVVLFNAGLV